MITLTTNWKKYQLNTTDSAAVNNLKIKIKPQSNGIYSLDDFNFYPLTTLPINTEICNGDFETGVTGWSQANNGANITAVSDSTTYQNGNFSAKIDVSNTLNGQPIFSSCKSDIEKNKKYRIHFLGKISIRRTTCYSYKLSEFSSLHKLWNRVIYFNNKLDRIYIHKRI